MKGTFFQKPLEFRIDVQGERWSQGESISGCLTIKNHEKAELSASEARVDLALGELKQLRQKSPEAFRSLQCLRVEATTLKPQEEITVPWKFETDRNVPITDGKASLFLLYGKGSALEQLGQLQLNFEPDPIIQEVLKVLETDFRFVVKSRKHLKDATEVKLAPPDSKSFVALEQLILTSRFERDDLQTKFAFGVKKISATAASLDLQKEKKEFDRSFSPSQYRTPSGRFNHEFMEGAIREIISQVESKILF